MKVGTDGVLVGAWATVRPGAVVWDAGAGSGLISLMCAQRGASRVTAFEIDPAACGAARRNVAASPWHDIITVEEGDFVSRAAALEGDAPDLIVSNPPFFNETLHAPDPERAAARHEGGMTITDIMRVAAARLAPGGRLALIAPTNRMEELLFEARMARLWPLRITSIVTVEGKKPKRWLGEWTTTDPLSRPAESVLAIRGRDNVFTAAYGRLVGDFYL